MPQPTGKFACLDYIYIYIYEHIYYIYIYMFVNICPEAACLSYCSTLVSHHGGPCHIPPLWGKLNYSESSSIIEISFNPCSLEEWGPSKQVSLAKQQESHPSLWNAPLAPHSLEDWQLQQAMEGWLLALQRSLFPLGLAVAEVA